MEIQGSPRGAVTEQPTVMAKEPVVTNPDRALNNAPTKLVKMWRRHLTTFTKGNSVGPQRAAEPAPAVAPTPETAVANSTPAAVATPEPAAPAVESSKSAVTATPGEITPPELMENADASSAKEAEIVARRIKAEELFKNDTRLLPYLDKHLAYLDPRKQGDQLRSLATVDYITAITQSETRSLPGITPEEAYNAYAQIRAKEAQLEADAHAALSEGKPLPAGVEIDKDGNVRVRMSPREEAHIAIDAIIPPRVEKRIFELQKEHISVELFATEADRNITLEALAINPDNEEQALLEKVRSRRAKEEQNAQSEVLKSIRFPLTDPEKEGILKLAASHRSEESGLIDESVYPIIVNDIVTNKVNAIIARDYNKANMYPYTFDLKRIIDAVKGGADPKEMIEKYKKGKRRRIFEGVLPAMFKKIFQDTNSG